MTEKLWALMDQRAGEPDFAVPDLAAVRGAGLRRRRRRRAGVAGTGLAATAVLVAGALVAVGTARDADGGPDVASDPPPVWAPTPFAYAVGTVVHDGGREIEVDHPVQALVRTRVGYVTADDDERIWSVVDGREEQIGSTGGDPVELVSDPQRSQVAWVDAAQQAVVVHDQTDGTEATYGIDRAPTATDAPSDHLYALDAGVLYVRSGGAAVAIDLATRAETVLDPRVSPDSDVLDAASGRVAFIDADYEVSVGPTRARSRVRLEAKSPYGQLSPDAAFLAMTGDNGLVYDVSTGRAVDLGRTGFYESVLWADATHLVAVAESAPGSGVGVLLDCDVVRRSCRTAVELGLISELEEDIVFATGTT